VQTEFNKLKESDKDILLVDLGLGKGSNAKERKDLFRKAILKKQFTFEELMQKLKKGTE
jgi:tRNA A-37 threonylcarbamoyl transferase component Bud32